MSRTASQLNVPLSHLVPSRRNPRRVKPAREAHRRLVAAIRSHGLLQPLVVQPTEGKPGHYTVIAGHRRLAALREVYRGDGDPGVPCVLRDVDAGTADALSLGENFAREAMHPLDEAEVFASVPDEKQVEVWTELNGHPRHAEHVRNVIAHGWVDAKHALFDVSTLPDWTVSRDLFSEAVRVERAPFMSAQLEAMGAERARLIEEGWHEAIAGRYEDISSLPSTMDPPEREYDAATAAMLAKLARRFEKWEAKLQEVPDDDEAKLSAIQEKMEALEDEHRAVDAAAPVHFSEATKAIGTAFLILYPDGQVRREYRVPRSRNRSIGGNGHTNGTDGHVGGHPTPPASETSSDEQFAASFAHEALAVREASLSHPGRPVAIARPDPARRRCRRGAIRPP